MTEQFQQEPIAIECPRDDNEAILLIPPDANEAVLQSPHDCHESFFEHSTKIRRKVVKLEKAVLRGSSVAVRAEEFFYFEETKAVDKNLKLSLVRSCTRDRNCPVMPLLRLEMADREYHEPVRDRDKNWVLDSQRHIIDRKGSEVIAPRFGLGLGQYPRDSYGTSKLFWATENQAYLRETRLLRKSKIISETNCVVEVFGIGFNGRLFSEGSDKPKFLVVEVYSIWNCQKYVAALSMLQLRLLLGKQSDLLRPGRKMDLINAIVDGLYFQYTITIKENAGTLPTRTDSLNLADTATSHHSTNGPPSSSQSQLTEAHHADNHFSKQTVIHLQRPHMPKGYPSTVEQMIRIPPVAPEDSTAPLPVVEQELLMGITEMRNGIRLRMLESAERKMLQDQEDRRLYSIWLATKKRKRGLVAIRLLRGGTHFAVVAAYHDSMRPTTVILKAVILDEAVPIKMFVGLNAIQTLLGVQSNTLKWSMDEIKAFTHKTLQFVQLVTTDSGAKILKLNDLNGTEGRLVKAKSLTKNIESLELRKKATFAPRDNSKHGILHHPVIKGIDVGNATGRSSNTEAQVDGALSQPLATDHHHNWCSLGLNGRNRRAGSALGVLSRPCRDVGRGIRLTSRAISIGGIDCIYTLYARCMVGPVGSVPLWPVEVDTKKDPSPDGAAMEVDGAESEFGEHDEVEDVENTSMDDDEVIDAGNLEADIKNESFAAIANGVHFDLLIYIPFGGALIGREVTACSTYLLAFSKDAFDTLVSATSRELVGSALRSLYRRFYSEASAEEVSVAERCWDFIGREMMLRCRWDSTDSVDGKISLTTDELPVSTDGFSNTTSLMRTFAKRVVRSDDVAVGISANTVIDSLPQGSNLKEVPYNVTLSWSDVIFRKTMKIRSAAQSRGESIALQVFVAQKHQDMVVICFDPLTNDVYSAIHEDKELVASHLVNYRFLPERDRMLQIYFFVFSQLTYTEVLDNNNALRGMVTFQTVQEEATAIDLSAVVEDDYSSNAESMLAMAQEKAKNRLKRDR